MSLLILSLSILLVIELISADDGRVVLMSCFDEAAVARERKRARMAKKNRLMIRFIVIYDQDGGRHAFIRILMERGSRVRRRVSLYLECGEANLGSNLSQLVD